MSTGNVRTLRHQQAAKQTSTKVLRLSTALAGARLTTNQQWIPVMLIKTSKQQKLEASQYIPESG
jgi:hypothetical protein